MKPPSMFHFRIRDVLWLTVVVAVALGLWLRSSKEKSALLEEIAARETKMRMQIEALLEESAARETKMRKQAEADYGKTKNELMALYEENAKLLVKSRE